MAHKNPQQIDLLRQVYSKSEYTKIIDTEFNQLGQICWVFDPIAKEEQIRGWIDKELKNTDISDPKNHFQRPWSYFTPQ